MNFFKTMKSRME